jgi:hypothetical protein
MIKQGSLVVLSILVLFFYSTIELSGQVTPGQKDTFFLSKKKGLLGKLGKSISVEPAVVPVKIANPYRVHAGKTIRSIYVLSLGFERNIYDTTKFRNTFSAILANAVHKNTREKIIRNNLFFREGSKINPYIVADNERHLRDLVYIQDARILLAAVPGSTDLVDVTVISKDVFSIGGSLNVSGVDRVRASIKEVNVGGSGSQLSVSGFYEKGRNPPLGYGAEYIRRNMKGSFIDWTVGFLTYNSAFNSGRNEESYVYTHFSRPLVSLFIPWIGEAEFSINKTNNYYYLKDSLYNTDFKYGYYNLDAWVGYNIGHKKLAIEGVNEDMTNRVRKFVAIRGLHQRFNELPLKNQFVYDYRYANISGALASLSIFKQEFYRTNFIYGFGINEDVPEGYSASIIGGWTDKENRTRSYYGLEGQRTHFSQKGVYSAYTFGIGAYLFKNRWEDIDLLISLEHFTKLNKLSGKWLNRNFYSASFTHQLRPVLNTPLFLRSEFGLPYYDNTTINADFRGTLKGETVFYNMTKFWGFRMAPFLFGNLSFIRPINESYSKTDMYSALGAGVRTRNENLVFGTIELRGLFLSKAHWVHERL